jgi:hypothetical protein
MIDPGAKLLRDEWSNPVQLGEIATARNQINRAFRPKKRAAGRAPKSTHPDSGTIFSLAREPFRQLRIRNVVL